MNSELWTIIAATGSYIPTRIVKNEDFLKNDFHDANGNKIANNPDTIHKFEEITGIKERRWADAHLVTSDIAFYAAFLQAEDGIRDWSVTGVQTCALPI